MLVTKRSCLIKYPISFPLLDPSMDRNSPFTLTIFRIYPSHFHSVQSKNMKLSSVINPHKKNNNRVHILKSVFLFIFKSMCKYEGKYRFNIFCTLIIQINYFGNSIVIVVFFKNRNSIGMFGDFFKIIWRFTVRKIFTNKKKTKIHIRIVAYLTIIINRNRGVRWVNVKESIYLQTKKKFHFIR